MHNGDAQALLAMAQRSITEACDKVLTVTSYDAYAMALGDMLRTFGTLVLVLGYLVEQDAKKTTAPVRLDGLNNDILPQQ